MPVAQVLLFVFLFSFAAGTLIGGPLGDRFGRKYVIWASILGILPFTLILPHVGLVWTVILTVPIGIGLASAFPAIIVFAQELVPGSTGMISGIFFGLAFGMGGIGAAALGELADCTSIEFVYQVCAFLPAIGLLTVFLPNIERQARPEPARGDRRPRSWQESAMADFPDDRRRIAAQAIVARRAGQACGRRGGWRARTSPRAKRDATILAIKRQEDAGIDIVSDGEQSRRHFVHGFLEFVDGIDFEHQVADGHPRQPLHRDGADGGRRDQAAAAASTRTRRGRRARTRRAS